MIEIKVPQLPESVNDATLVHWHKKVGDFVKREENLIDLETDKVILELPAPENGILTAIMAIDGQTVHSKQIIALLDNAQTSSNTPEVKPRSVDGSNTQPIVNTIVSSKPIMPAAAKKLAENPHIDINTISGSGRDGRILSEDIKSTTNSPAIKYDKDPVANLVANTSIESSASRDKIVPMSKLRQRIAERLLFSQQQNAILTTFNEVNMAEIIRIRTSYQKEFIAKHSVKLGFMSFFIKATVAALIRYPIINASIEGTNLVYHEYYDIGVAVSTERGLVVPIIRDCLGLSLADIELKIIDFGNRAKSGKLSLAELTGGTFSITNGGTFGSLLSTPIINPPQSAILGMHAIKDRPIAEDSAVVIRPIMNLALSYDHRIIDGREAVLFLVAIKELLENPIRLLLE
jgi:2-oxoglutarate dehydrogenase E2 component (dihydrolipoamide succinyltransferase)